MVHSTDHNRSKVSSGAALQLVYSDAAAGGEVSQHPSLQETIEVARVLGPAFLDDEVTRDIIGRLEYVRHQTYLGQLLAEDALEKFRKTVGVANNQSAIDDDWEAECARPLCLDDEHPDANGFEALLVDLFMHNEPARLGVTRREQQLAYQRFSGNNGRDFDSSKLSSRYEEGADKIV